MKFNVDRKEYNEILNSPGQDEWFSKKMEELGFKEDPAINEYSQLIIGRKNESDNDLNHDYYYSENMSKLYDTNIEEKSSYTKIRGVA